MKVICKGKAITQNNGKFDIQIEDWSKDYPGTFSPNDTLATYPVATTDHNSYFGPRRFQRYRFDFRFPEGDMAMEAFNALCNGEAELNDYFEYINRKDFIPCLTGNENSEGRKWSYVWQSQT